MSLFCLSVAAYNPFYTVQWEDRNGAVIYTGSAGNFPHAIVYQYEDLIAEPLEYIKEQYTPHIEQKYGDAPVACKEYGTYANGGKKLPAELYTG